MSVDSQHPDYQNRTADWLLMRDTYAGVRTIKNKRFEYLPPTAGMVLDGAKGPSGGQEPGRSAYDAYIRRAIFPEFVRDATNVLVGVMHRKPAKIELPPELEPMRDNATRQGESLLALLRRCNEEQLITGRFGMLADVKTGPGTITPHIVTYKTEDVINWDNDTTDASAPNRLTLAVMREVVNVRSSDFEWSQELRHRVCTINADGQYETFTDRDGIGESGKVVPSLSGRPLTEIPFITIGANDLLLAPDDIPLLALANMAISVYQSEADLRQTLFMLGQDTLAIIGEQSIDEDGDDTSTKPTRVGAGASIHVPKGGDVKMVGVSGNGLPEQRRTLGDDYTRAREAGSRLLEPRSGQAESGEALKVRVAAQTSTLHQIAITGAAGLEKILKMCATWRGADPSLVRVIPNVDFAETSVKPPDVLALIQAKAAGAPLSFEAIHKWLVANGYTDVDFEAEVAKIKKEEELKALLVPAPPPKAVPGDPNGGPPGQKMQDTKPAQ